MGAKGYKGESVMQERAAAWTKGVSGARAIGLRAGWAVIQAAHVPEKAEQWARHREREAALWYHGQQEHVKALSSMLGPSGLVGSLHHDLLSNQSYVNYG